MKKIIPWLLVGVIVIAGIMIFKPEAKRATKIKVGILSAEELTYAPAIIADKKNFFVSNQINVEIVRFNSSADERQALSTGTVDIALVSLPQMLTPLSKGASVQMIGSLSVQPLSVFVRKDGSIKKLSDLSGKKIEALPGGSMHFIIANVLRKEGVNLNNVTFAQLDESSIPSAMARGAVDASPATFYHEDEYLKAGEVQIAEWVEKGYSTVNTGGITDTNIGVLIAANSKFLSGEGNREKTESFLKGIIEGVKFIKSNSDESAKIISDDQKKVSDNAIEISPEYIKQSWKEKKIQYLVWTDPSVFKETIDSAIKIGIIPEGSVDVNKVIDTSFRPLLENAQKDL